MNVLKVEGLCKAYPSFRLEGVSFSLESGTITGFIGRNGAGKSTTLKAILGLVCPDSGSVAFFGGQQDLLRDKQEIGYVNGGFACYPRKKLRDITAVTRLFYDRWDADVYQRCMRQFSLDEGKTVSQLSEGMKVKYALTLALSHQAKLLILDEPTSGLDPLSREELMDIFRALREQGSTILFSTHITSDLEKCADRILYIRNGQLVADDALPHFISTHGGSLDDAIVRLEREGRK